MREKEKILKMVSEGKISVDDAEKLLNAISENRVGRTRPEQKMIKVMDRFKQAIPRSGKIIIDIQSSRSESVKIKLPLKLATLAMNMIPKQKLAEMDHEGVHIKDILVRISEMVDEVDEDILNVTSASGDSIRIYIERN